MSGVGWAGGGCGDPLLTAPVQACEMLSEGLASSCLSPNLVEVQGGLAAAVKLSNRSAAVRLRLIREAIERQGGARYPRAAVRAFLIRECRISEGTARKEIAAALATGPRGPLPLLGQALATGEITREHVDVAVTMLGSIPARLVSARGREIDAVMADWSRTWVAADVKTLAAQLSATLHPTDADKAADDAFETRSAQVGVGADGTVHLQAHLDPADGAVFKAVLEELAGPDHRSAGATTGSDTSTDGSEGGRVTGAADRDGQAAPALDDRTREQRLADALGEMARLAQLGMSSEHPAAEPTRLVVVATIEQLAHPSDDPHADEPSTQPEPTDPAEPAEAAEPAASAERTEATERAATAESPPAAESAPAGEPEKQQGQGVLPVACAAPGLARALGVGLLAATTLHRLACDSIVERVLLDRRGAIVAMETLGRFATPAQARALAARDGGCARPGCGAPPARCDVHHVTFWSRGGKTRIDDMVLLCGPDHTLIHREDWRIVMDHGVPWFIPPPWIDPDQTPLRNTLHTAIADAQRLGQRLRQPPRQPPLAA